ncbi:MAG: SMC-Scp complex subunit ScpB [Spirulina sp. SIO3F2]|nr:SMC-Scp complex subunit ScpB [Spirulina sp. SIO3F2]
MSELPEPRLATKIEAILYLKGQALPVAAIAELAGCKRKHAQTALLELMDDYAYRDSALEVVETEAGYSLQLKAGFSHLIHDLVPAELKLGALRTLAVIALKSPIVQTELIDLRGSTAYQHVPELVELGFVRKRRQTEGRSFLLEVTAKFHQYFEVDELSEIMKQLQAEVKESISAATDDSRITTPSDSPQSNSQQSKSAG